MGIVPTIDRICLISNYNLYESKRHFALKFAEALERKGIETLIIDAGEAAVDLETIKRIYNFKPTLTSSFNTILPLSEQHYLWDELKIPHWSILVDPVIYNMGLAHSPYSIVSCVDMGDCQQLSSATDSRVFFFPHAVERNLNGQGDEHKPYDVVFFGSCYDYEGLRQSWQDRHSPEVNNMLDEAIDIVLTDTTTSIAEALVTSWNRSLLSPSGIDFFTLFYYVDYYTRGKERVELIRAIKDVPVHVFGETSQEMDVNRLGWDHYLGDCKNVKLHPSVPFTESLKILKKSKIALNSMPFFKQGTHERVFTALGSGALPITAGNIFWLDHFINEEDIALYAPGKWHQAGELVHRYLSDENLRQEVVAKGVAKVQQEHNWDRRAEQALEMLPPLLSQINRGE
ncbi:MAG: glycosyltransferase [Parachlamydiaceae bacterium]|nr:glycosyltransferase [Parachlamydiaceae bacterium]